MVGSVVISKAEKDDLEELSLFLRRILRYHEGLDKRFRLDLVGLMTARDITRGLLQNQEWSIWVARGQGKVEGAISGKLLCAPGGAASGSVGDIWVEEAFRRRRVGSQLFHSLREEFLSEGATSIQLQVAQANLGALAFWESLGFQAYMDNLWWEGAGSPKPSKLPQGVSVRPARSEDLEPVVGLWKAQVDKEEALDRRAHLGPGAEGAFRDNLSRWLRQEEARLVVAQAGGDIVGYGLGLVHQNAPFLALSRYGQVAELCVAPGWRGQGVGTALFGALAEWWKGQIIGVVQANVLRRNVIGERFLRGLGFSDYMLHLWLDL